MADILIETSVSEQTLGGLMTGYVVISTKYTLNYSEILLTLFIRERTKVEDNPPGAPTYKRFLYKETHLVYEKEYKIADYDTVRNETKRVPFSIRLPIDYPGTFKGLLSSVEYTLEVRILSEHAPEHKYEMKIVARDRLESIPIKSVLKEVQGFSLYLDSDTFCVNKSLKGKLGIAEDVHIRGANFEIWNTETAIAEGHTDTIRSKTLQGRLKGMDFSKEGWTEFEIDMDRKLPVTAIGKNFQSTNELIVKLDTKFHTDRIISIPINLVYCYEFRDESIDFDTFD